MTDFRSNTDSFRMAVVAALGSAPEVIEPGVLQRFATNGKRGDAAGWCQFFSDGRAGVFGDWRTSMQGVWTASDRSKMNRAEAAALARQLREAAAARAAAKRAAWSTAAGRLTALWGACKPVDPADEVTKYLRRRLVLADDDTLVVPEVIGRHPGLAYHHDGAVIGTWPAMVAVLQAPDGTAIALHRTWIDADGRKAPVPGPVKKLSATSGPVMGGCIRLVSGDEWDGAALGIAEGIETALAARAASGVPTVAAYSAGALAAWIWPDGLERLVIFADADEAGAKAAEALRCRARAAGLNVRIVAPSTPGADWCDVWAARGAANPEGVNA